MGKKEKEKEKVRKYYIQDEQGKKFVKNFIIIEYNMDKIMEIWYSKNRKEIEKYKYLIMLDLSLEELKELSKKDRLVEKYRMNVEIVNKDPRFRVYMTEEEDRRKIYNTEMRMARETGLKEGHEKGLEQGAKENSLEVARKMIAKGFAVEDIIECTHLSVAEIQALKEE